jgi:hypothetical protein
MIGADAGMDNVYLRDVQTYVLFLYIFMIKLATPYPEVLHI